MFWIGVGVGIVASVAAAGAIYLYAAFKAQGEDET